MMYELRDIGFSTCVGIGGDPVIGTTHIDCLAAFQDDPDTDAIVMIGEIGGDAEERAAAYIKEHVTKPVVGYVAGFTAPEGKTMGHAGAIVSGSSGTAAAKQEALEAVGVQVGKTPSETARLMAVGGGEGGTLVGGGKERHRPGVQDINRNDLGVMGAGALAFIASFLPYYGYFVPRHHRRVDAHRREQRQRERVAQLRHPRAAPHLRGGDRHRGQDLRGVIDAVDSGWLARSRRRLGCAWHVARHPPRLHRPISASGPGGSVGVKWGGYVLFIAGVAEVVFAVLGMRESGEKVAWQQPAEPLPPPPTAPPPPDRSGDVLLLYPVNEAAGVVVQVERRLRRVVRVIVKGSRGR